MATFNASGLASGMDTNALVEALSQLRQLSVTRLKAKQGAYTTQISVIGDVVNRLQGLKTAATGLGTGGTLGISQSGTLDGITTSPSSSAQAGRYTVEVKGLAAAAKQRSTGFTAASPPVTAGVLSINVNGTAKNVNVGAGASLTDVATAINAGVSDVSAVVLSDGTNSYLSITNRATGYTIGGQPTDALQISGTAAAQFGFSEVVPAKNAEVWVDGLKFDRRSNTFDDVIPGVSLTVSKEDGPPQELVLTNDTAGTAKNIQGFVDAYNLVLKSVQKQLTVSSSSDRSATLAGDGSLRSLQAALGGLTSKTVGAGVVRTLADLGVKTARDGSLSVDSVALGKAIAKDPAGVNALFNTAATGVSALTTALVDGYTDADGVLTARTKGMQGQVARLGKDVERAQAAVDRYKELLVKQFTAMEQIVSTLKSTGNYLTSQEKVNDK
jgi:flagellar hook-associated protein 2